VILVNAAARRVDAAAGELYHLILKLWREANPAEARVSNAVSFTVIKDAVRKNDGGSPMLMEHFDQYLRVLCEDSTGLISRTGDSRGGQFAVNYADVFENLACAVLDSVVLERFGSKALRIFRCGGIFKMVN
jgi:DNA-directed RNA polymerase III subunit RPC3